MSFVSFTFAAFFLVVLVARAALDRPRTRSAWIGFLLVASLVFYAWAVPWHVAVLLAIALTGYLAARAVGARPYDARGSRAAATIAITVGLGLLALFKYADYLAASVGGFGVALGREASPFAPMALVLPLGISFYTFEMISYVVDVRRGRIAAERRFDRLLLFFAFFPHLVAGQSSAPATSFRRSTVGVA